MNGYTEKILRLLSNNAGIDEHIKNLFSFKLPFFQKLALYRGLDMNFEILKKIVRVNSSVWSLKFVNLDQS